MNPLRDPFANILTVQIQGDLAGTLQCEQGLNHRCELHSVVGGI
jgi:hypothetical protein